MRPQWRTGLATHETAATQAAVSQQIMRLFICVSSFGDSMGDQQWSAGLRKRFPVRQPVESPSSFGDVGGGFCKPHHLEVNMTQNTIGTSAAVTPTLEIIDGQITTTSQQVAEHFGKRHSDVIRSIRRLSSELEPEWYERNFAFIQKTTVLGKGRTRTDPAYAITRDGFALLAMGFTGKEALHWKVAYITAFNKMESALANQAARQTIPVTLYEQALQVETKEAKSFALAQAGSRAMLLRKSEKKELVETVALMREAIQLRLALGYSTYA